METTLTRICQLYPSKPFYNYSEQQGRFTISNAEGIKSGLLLVMPVTNSIRKVIFRLYGSEAGPTVVQQLKESLRLNSLIILYVLYVYACTASMRIDWTGYLPAPVCQLTGDMSYETYAWLSKRMYNLLTKSYLVCFPQSLSLLLMKVSYGLLNQPV